jgi:uncharacterized protein (DUF924 family)
MDTAKINEVLEFWFADRGRNEPTLDSRMTRWFGADARFDAELAERFGALTEQALAGELDGWAETPLGRLALIMLLEQFPRRLYKDSPKAFQGDRKAMQLCQQGVANDSYRELNAVQQLFFFMPLQRAESIKIQQTSVKIYNALSSKASNTLRDTFETVAHFAELRRDIIEKFGRFPHRNAPLGRSNTGAEDAELIQ